MKHSFAKYWLAKLGNQILINGHDFFAKDLNKLKFEIKPLETSLVVGESLLDEQELSKVIDISYLDMKKLGLAIYIMPADEKAWRKSQRNIFYIGKKRLGFMDIPEGSVRRKKSEGKIKIWWDRMNKCIKVDGEDFGTPDGYFGTGATTPWVYYDFKREKKVKLGKFEKLDNLYSQDEIDDAADRWFDMKQGIMDEPINRKTINELPVMITEEGYLLCLPKPKKTEPLPRMLIVGKSGRGKSYSLNSILGRVVYIFRHRAGLLNDSLNQFYDLMLPMPDEPFINTLNIIGNEPRDLPVINLYMSCPNVEIEYQNEQVGYRLVVSFEDFLRGYKSWTYGVSRWDLGKAESYMTGEVINSIKTCKTSDEIKTKLFQVLETVDDKGKKKEGIVSMIMKWHSKFDNILRDEFTSNLFNEETTAPYWKLKKADGEELTGHPFLISMEAGLVPVINNYLAKDYPIAKKQMARLLHQIVRWQMRRGKDKQLQMWIFVDELKDFLGKKTDELYEALDYFFTQCRFNRIGICANIQEYTKLSDSMRANSTHLIIFELQTDSERRAVAKDYRLDKEKLDSIAELKTFQCLFTTKEKVVLYKEGNREVVEGGLWKGKVLPPITTHKSP